MDKDKFPAQWQVFGYFDGEGGGNVYPVKYGTFESSSGAYEYMHDKLKYPQYNERNRTYFVLPVYEVPNE